MWQHAIISYHIISYHIILYHIILYHIILYHIILYHIILYHIISCHIISYHIILYYIILYHVISCHIISYHIMSYHVILYHIISHHVILYQAMLYYIMPYHPTTILSFLILKCISTSDIDEIKERLFWSNLTSWIDFTASLLTARSHPPCVSPSAAAMVNSDWMTLINACISLFEGTAAEERILKKVEESGKKRYQ